MPRVVPSARKRAFHPKTKGGCVRRVKCDEAKPACLKCVSTGRKCDGYSAAPATSSASPSEASLDPSTTPDFYSLAIVKTPSTEIIGSDLERRSFHFFQHKTARHLSGYFGETFWDQQILRATHYEPCIKHAIIALGAVSERFEAGGAALSRSISPQDDFALQEYNLAIRLLLEPFHRKTPASLDVCLIACILFSCFETIRGSYGSAIAHVRSGNKVLCEMFYNKGTKKQQHDVLDTSTSLHVPVEELAGIFLRLDWQITSMIGGRDWDLIKQSDRFRQKIRTPAIFPTLAEARNALVYNWQKISYNGMMLLHSAPDDPAFATLNNRNSDHRLIAGEARGGWQRNAIDITGEWSAALEAFVSVKRGRLTENERIGVGILRIQKELAMCALLIVREDRDDQMKWDEFIPNFAYIVAMAKTIVLPSPVPHFSLDVGINAPLYEVASRCRDPVIRRDAIKLLKISARQEGVWNAALTAKVAEKVVKIEESGLGEVRCCADVPDWARISDVEPTFDQYGRRATIRYSRFKNASDARRQPVEEVIEW